MLFGHLNTKNSEACNDKSVRYLNTSIPFVHYLHYFLSCFVGWDF